ncbi:MAG: hypothetical protein J7L72_10745 [Candidatus Aminicenantes bacterium]|nr:hypothetical protein [Candidatus Aminicenantes bacterium]HHF51432.1 hypothetical protein [Candidatus Aminicenantes bacterium]
MEYLIFSYPKCPNCESLKKALEKTPFQGKEYSLVKKEGKVKIREYLKVINRDKKGAIILPTLLMIDNEKVIKVINSPQELQNWLRSKD